MSGALVVDAGLVIPRHELSFRATRAGGPGGQHVNTSSTRVEVLWNVHDSRAIDDGRRAIILEKLATRLDARGNLRVVGSAYRSQARNREDAETRLAALVRRALDVPTPRRKTKPTRAAREQRLEKKRERSEKKARRRFSYDES